MTTGDIANDAVDSHGRCGLNDDDAVDDEMPQFKGATKAPGSDGGLRSLTGGRVQGWPFIDGKSVATATVARERQICTEFKRDEKAVDSVGKRLKPFPKREDLRDRVALPPLRESKRLFGAPSRDTGRRFFPESNLLN